MIHEHVFLVFAQNIDCLVPISNYGDSTKYHQPMSWAEISKQKISFFFSSEKGQFYGCKEYSIWACYDMWYMLEK